MIVTLDSEAKLFFYNNVDQMLTSRSLFFSLHFFTLIQNILTATV